jgi:colanic acid/amylovoran biosynthesis glycosyltransferase
MRIALFTAEFPGKINTFFARDVCALIRAGIDVDVFPIYPLRAQYWSAVPPLLGPDVLPRSRVHHASPLAAARPCSTSLAATARFAADTARIRWSAVRYGPGPWIKSEYVFLKAWAWRHHAADGYDHVLAYWGNYAATAAYLFHGLLGRRVPLSILLHAHDLYARQVFFRQKLLEADNIFIVCDFNRRFLAAQYADIFPRLADKLHVHHLGLDLETIAPSLEGRRPHTCLAVGRLDPSKGFDVLLHAIAKVRQRGLPVELEIVGDGTQGGALRALVSKLDLGSQVRFRGWLPFDEVPFVMRRATMLVHPSRGLGDAVPTVIKEAMALGTPVIGSTAVGIPELLDGGRAGLLVAEGDADQLAAAIARLLGDADLRQRLAGAGRAFAEQTFDLWRNGQQLADRLRATHREAGGPHPAAERTSGVHA